MGDKPFSKMINSNIAIFLGALFFFAVAAFFMREIWLGIVEFAIWIILTVYTFVHEAKIERDMEEYVQTLSFHADKTTKDSLLRFPLPLVVVGPDSTIIWYNEPFQNIFEGNKLFDKNLNRIMGMEFNIANLVETKYQTGFNVEYNNHFYKVLPNILDTGRNDGYAVLYWIDETDYVTAKKLYDDSRNVTAIIMIDNYDEVIQNTPDEATPMLLAAIDKTITDWANASEGVFKKMARDRYILVFEYKYLREYMEQRFTILEALKNINVKNKLPPTASIGIGIFGKNMAQNDVFARSAIDMALGRGGDQVVIKDSEKFTYFGGNSKETEKHTRVKTRVMSHALKQLIIESQSVMIMGHRNSDLDSLGACIGLYAAISKFSSDVSIVLESVNNSSVKLLARLKANPNFNGAFVDHRTALENIEKGTLLIVVDVYRAYITECPELLTKTDNIVVLDHHRKTAGFIEHTALTYHEPYASSTCEMVTEVLQYIDDGESITKEVAEALYAGLVLDTKNFTIKSGVRTFEAAAYLRKKGVDTIYVKQLFQSDLLVYSQRSDIVKTMKIYKDNIAIAKNYNEVGDVVSIVATAADELLSIEGISASFVISKVGDKVYISARSLGEINVQIILEYIGGGGHMTVAGTQLDGTMEEVEIQLKNTIDKYLLENAKEEL